MDVPGHDAERRVHTDAVGIEGVELEVVVACHKESHQEEEKENELFQFFSYGISQFFLNTCHA